MPTFLLDWACIVEGEADLAPIGADADVVVEKVVARLEILDWGFSSAGHSVNLILCYLWIKNEFIARQLTPEASLKLTAFSLLPGASPLFKKERHFLLNTNISNPFNPGFF